MDNICLLLGKVLDFDYCLILYFGLALPYHGLVVIFNYGLLHCITKGVELGTIGLYVIKAPEFLDESSD